ncbi:unnamed protein product, partial [marine sediment metagenome]
FIFFGNNFRNFKIKFKILPKKIKTKNSIIKRIKKISNIIMLFELEKDEKLIEKATIKNKGTASKSKILK